MCPPLGCTALEAPREGRPDPTLFDTNLLLLRATGFWRLTRPGRGRILVLTQRAFFFMNVACNMAFLSSKLVHTAIDTSSIRSVTENMSDVLCIAFSLAQLLVLIRVEDRLVRLLHKIDEQFVCVLLSVRAESKAFSRQKEEGRRTTMRIFISFLGTGLNFAVIVASSGKKKHALPIPTDPGTLAILLMVEAVGVVLSVAGSGALSALLVNTLLVVRGQFREMQSYFRSEAAKIPDGALQDHEKVATLGRLVQGVKLHQAVYSLADELCHVLAPFLAVQLGTILFMICVAMFQISVNPVDPRNIRFIALVINVVVESFVLCLMGTRLSDEAMDVQLGLEDGDWCFHGKSIGHVVKLATMRSQRAPHIIVGSNVRVGLPTFLEMIRSSYSLLAFLQKRATRNEGN